MSEPNTDLKPEPKTQGGQFSSSLTPEALALRQYSAYKMRLAGASFDDIGRALSVSRQTASRDVAAVHAELKADVLEDLESLRQQQAARSTLRCLPSCPT